MNYIRKIPQNQLAGKTCLLRINLDIESPNEHSFRLQAVIPTVKFLLEAGARPLILSHRGRPQGQDPNLSLAPAMAILEKLIGQKLDWLENLRFDPRETADDENFARELAGRGGFYVNDDFASSHRASASLSAIKKFLPSYLGLLVEKELVALGGLRDDPRRPFVLILGGSKIEDKKQFIKEFAGRADKILLGGAFFDPPASDIDPKTAEEYCDSIKAAGTVVWNGPLGAIEKEEYAAGTRAALKAVAESGAFSVLGGGSLADFAVSAGLEDKISFLSTGGGAMLSFLAGYELPGLK